MKASGDMTCRELVDLVTNYLEGALPRAERVRFEEHLAYCPGCIDYLDQIGTTIALLGRLSEEDMPRETELAFLDAFRRWKAG